MCVSHLAGGGGVLLVPEAGADHGVADAVAPELLLPAGLEVDDGQAGLVQGLGQRHVLLPTWKVKGQTGSVGPRPPPE